MTRRWTVPILVGVLTATAQGTLVDISALSVAGSEAISESSGGTGNSSYGGVDLAPGRYDNSTIEPIEDLLTILGAQTDLDKDGFVDGASLAYANPTGYIVFDFRAWWNNARVSLGLVLWSDIGGPLAGSSAPTSPPPECAEPYWLDMPGPPAEVPEPATLALLAAGLASACRRRSALKMLRQLRSNRRAGLHNHRKLTPRIINTIAPANSARRPKALPAY